jgi:hypothetical protein
VLSPVSYRLNLPESYRRFHDVFHVSYLKPAVSLERGIMSEPVIPTLPPGLEDARRRVWTFQNQLPTFRLQTNTN